MTFFIPGMNPDGKRNWGAKMDENPKAKAWKESRGDKGDQSTGFEPGDRTVSFNGDPAIMHHEEHDPHTGKVEQYVQRSSRGDAGMYKVTWERSQSGELRITKTGRTQF